MSDKRSWWQLGRAIWKVASRLFQVKGSAQIDEVVDQIDQLIVATSPAPAGPPEQPPSTPAGPPTM